MWRGRGRVLQDRDGSASETVATNLARVGDRTVALRSIVARIDYRRVQMCVRCDAASSYDASAPNVRRDSDGNKKSGAAGRSDPRRRCVQVVNESSGLPTCRTARCDSLCVL